MRANAELWGRRSAAFGSRLDRRVMLNVRERREAAAKREAVELIEEIGLHRTAELLNVHLTTLASRVVTRPARVVRALLSASSSAWVATSALSMAAGIVVVMARAP